MNSKQTTSARVPSRKTTATSSRKRVHKAATEPGKVSEKKGDVLENPAVAGSGVRKAKRRSEKVLYPGGLLLPRAEIHALIDKTTHRQLLDMCGILVGVYEACETAFDENHRLRANTQLDPWALEHIESLPGVDYDPEFVRLLKLAETAVRRGGRGIRAARDTASEFMSYTDDDPDGEEGMRLTDYKRLMRKAGLTRSMKRVRKLLGVKE